MMYYCDHCKRSWEESELLEQFDDPSPQGISLPAGHYLTIMCPVCRNDDLIEYEEIDNEFVGVNKYGIPIYKDEKGNLVYEDGEEV